MKRFIHIVSGKGVVKSDLELLRIQNTNIKYHREVPEIIKTR